MVRATFKMSVLALALNPNLSVAISSNLWLAWSIWKKLFDMAVGHLGITIGLHSLKAIELNLSSSINAFLNLTG